MDTNRDAEYFEREQHLLRSCPLRIDNGSEDDARVAWYAFAESIRKPLRAQNGPLSGIEQDLAVQRAFFKGVQDSFGVDDGRAGVVHLHVDLIRPRKIGQGPRLNLSWKGGASINIQLEPAAFEIADRYLEFVRDSKALYANRISVEQSYEQVRRECSDADGRFEGGILTEEDVLPVHVAFNTAQDKARLARERVEQKQGLLRDEKERLCRNICKTLTAKHPRHAWLVPIVPTLAECALDKVRAPEQAPPQSGKERVPTPKGR